MELVSLSIRRPLEWSRIWYYNIPQQLCCTTLHSVTALSFRSLNARMNLTRVTLTKIGPKSRAMHLCISGSRSRGCMCLLSTGRTISTWTHDGKKSITSTRLSMADTRTIISSSFNNSNNSGSILAFVSSKSTTWASGWSCLHMHMRT